MSPCNTEKVDPWFKLERDPGSSWRIGKIKELPIVGHCEHEVHGVIIHTYTERTDPEHNGCHRYRVEFHDTSNDYVYVGWVTALYRQPVDELRFNHPTPTLIEF